MSLVPSGAYRVSSAHLGIVGSTDLRLFAGRSGPDVAAAARSNVTARLQPGSNCAFRGERVPEVGLRYFVSTLSAPDQFGGFNPELLCSHECSNDFGDAPSIYGYNYTSTQTTCESTMSETKPGSSMLRVFSIPAA